MGPELLLQATAIAAEATATWWEILNAVLMTAATVAVAAFGWIELRRQRLDARSRQKSMDAIASAQAYLLRRQILSWEELLGADSMKANQWIADRRLNGPVAEFETAKERNQALLALASQTSPKVGTAIREAAVHFLEGTARFERHAASPRPDGADLFVWLQLLDDGASDLKDTVRLLESGVIEPELLNAEGVSRRKRASSDPFAMLDPEGALAEEVHTTSTKGRDGR